jgi:hypothetical protein
MAVQNLNIIKGKTFAQVLRWEASPIVYKPITGITQTAPAVVTCTGHGAPTGWRVAIVSVKGMTQINAASTPPKTSEYHQATVLSANTIELNTVNAADYKPYVSGGYVQYNTPVDLAGFTARMSIKDKVGGAELLRLDTTLSNITIDNTAKTIALTLAATVTAALTFTKAVYDLELVSATGVVTLLLSGAVAVTNEVTTT